MYSEGLGPRPGKSARNTRETLFHQATATACRAMRCSHTAWTVSTTSSQESAPTFLAFSAISFRQRIPASAPLLTTGRRRIPCVRIVFQGCMNVFPRSTGIAFLWRRLYGEHSEFRRKPISVTHRITTINRKIGHVPVHCGGHP